MAPTAAETRITTNINKQFETVNTKFTDLANDLTSFKVEIMQLITVQDAKLTDLSNEITSFKSEVMQLTSAQDSRIASLENEVTELRALKAKVTKLETNLDEQEAYERRDCVIISGDALPPSTTGENCINVVREIARNNLKIQLAGADISTAHRIDKKPATQHPDRRSIIAKLCRRSTKSDLMFACKNQPEDSPRVYVNDSLTPIRNTIMYSLRQIRRAHPRLVTGCSSYDGKVYAYTKDPIAGRRDRRHLVNSHSELIKFCSEHVKQPLEAFLESWSH